jgi:hypothetical protein
MPAGSSIWVGVLDSAPPSSGSVGVIVVDTLSLLLHAASAASPSATSPRPAPGRDETRKLIGAP